jgi:hypothetical protein
MRGRHVSAPASVAWAVVALCPAFSAAVTERSEVHSAGNQYMRGVHVLGEVSSVRAVGFDATTAAEPIPRTGQAVALALRAPAAATAMRIDGFMLGSFHGLE